MNSMYRCLPVVLLLLFVTTAPILAQQDKTQPFVTADGTFRLDYPRQWLVRERPDGAVIFLGDDVNMTVFPPGVMGQLATRAAVESAEQLLQVFAEAFRASFQAQPAVDIEFKNGLRGVQAELTPTTSSGVTAPFMLVLASDDTYFSVVASGDGMDVATLEATIFPIIESIEVGQFPLPGSVTSDLPTLQHFDRPDVSEDAWVDAMAELEALELIPTGGNLIYSEAATGSGMMMLSGLEPGFRLIEDSQFESPDVAMAALISFRPDGTNDAALCALVPRVTLDQNNELERFLVVGITTNDHILLSETDENFKSPHTLEVATETDFDNPQHVLLIVQAQKLTVFLNGEAIVETWPLEVRPEEGDTMQVGINMDRSCVMTNVWALELPAQAET